MIDGFVLVGVVPDIHWVSLLFWISHFFAGFCPLGCFGPDVVMNHVEVSILPEIQNDAGDGVAYVGLRSHAPLEAGLNTC